MNDVPSAVYILAQHLIALEVHHAQGDEIRGVPALRAVEKLRSPLSKLSGVEGYRILLLRALTLSKARAPSLSALVPAPDGSLQLPDRATPGIEAGITAEGMEDGNILLSELLGLLIIFIGEALTLQLLRSVWPDATLDHLNTDHKETLR